MKLAREIIGLVEKEHFEVEYYYLLIETIESNKGLNPDICIETCKSLLEGISKFILKKIDTTYNGQAIDNLDFHQIVKKSSLKLGEYSLSFEVDFVRKLEDLMKVVGNIRNKRGDISHGRLSPKEIKSDLLFSDLVMSITDSVLHYKLKCFCDVNLAKEIRYEDYMNFNEWLDTVNPIGSISYSKALFDQEIKTYKQQLFDYLDLNGLSEE
ncbi:abortive infection family protein [Dyadobacter fermentans]|uniref:Abortive infection protein-like C-terminal domain-containing protein n=1 Tax=Dyadobacter fermentans (strain ATCC 700827 / DSM 18053 / CIP 107007 / KCTC 52180 / NS114) TaxID=471854 RepID=C6VT74_DYAFD|nr:abortive infection family protein [Dyadobacter fermentans]ACT96438.1 hypothetical protein Dfer_5243 [Dyadobacter fermentans DSM 18053]